MSTVSIFMYHDIRDVNPNDRFFNRYQNRSFVNVQQFKNQLSYMKDRFQFISPFHIKSALQDKSSTHYAVMTFDDGLIDHYDVLPLLDKYNIMGTFFIPGNVLDKNFIIDSNQVQMLESEVDMHTLAQEILDLLGDEKDEAWEKYSKSKFRVNTWPKEKTFITNCLRDHPKDLLNPLVRKYISEDYESISNIFYLNENHIKCVYEKPGSLKIGTYIPGTRIPIVSDDEIVDISLKTGLINNAWHISTEIEGYLRNLGFNGQLINII